MIPFFKMEVETSEVNEKCQVLVKTFDYKRSEMALKCNPIQCNIMAKKLLNI